MNARGDFATVVTAFTLLVGCVSTGAAQAQERLRLATGVDATFLTLVVAHEKGFMKKHGIDSEVRQFASGALSLESVVSGDTDMAFASELAVLRPRAKGARIVGLARSLYADDLMGIGAKTAVTKPADLVGRPIGYMKGTASEYFLHLYLAKHHLDPKRLRLVNVGAPEMVPAMARGDVEVIFAWEPWFTRMRAAVPDTHVLAKSGQDGVYRLQYLVMVSETSLAAKRKSLEGAMGALIDATAWLNERSNAPEAAAILARTYRIAPADAERQLTEVKYVIDLTREFQSDLQRAAGWLAAQGLIERGSEAGVISGLIVPDVLRAVAPARIEQ
jgi:taurine transport system substrate-binding protein